MGETVKVHARYGISAVQPDFPRVSPEESHALEQRLFRNRVFTAVLLCAPLVFLSCITRLLWQVAK